MDLMKMEEITEVQWQVRMKILTLKIVKGGKLVKILKEVQVNHLFCSLMSCRFMLRPQTLLELGQRVHLQCNS